MILARLQGERHEGIYFVSSVVLMSNLVNNIDLLLFNEDISMKPLELTEFNSTTALSSLSNWLDAATEKEIIELQRKLLKMNIHSDHILQKHFSSTNLYPNSREIMSK